LFAHLEAFEEQLQRAFWTISVPLIGSIPVLDGACSPAQPGNLTDRVVAHAFGHRIAHVSLIFRGRLSSKMITSEGDEK
jgi:hypothetical protein